MTKRLTPFSLHAVFELGSKTGTGTPHLEELTDSSFASIGADMLSSVQFLIPWLNWARI